MKVKSERENTFNPVTITITIESKEELELLRSLMRHNMTVPEMVTSGYDNRKKLGDMMGSIIFSLP